MKLLKVFKAMIEYRKTMKTTKVVSLADAETYDLLSMYCGYRAQESVSKYYCAFHPGTSMDEAKELIRYSKALRDTIKEVIYDRLVHVKPEEFDFALKVNDIHFFQEFENMDQHLTISKLYPREYGVMLIQLLSIKVEQAYYIFLRNEKGYQKEWKDFVDDFVNIEGFGEPAYTALKYWIANLTFPESVWINKQVLGLMNEGKQRIEIFGKQD